ncbi:Monocyte to macrophage differentiation factor 2 [Schistosoma japonicum]|uniref:Monocyte to macrophage differentiation factor 2 n=1 Tax=Schistosoma japonicum TaxID=6182 RepID=A0A4Z2CNT4_SCHJA|nr:Monocyte to macrophage differentiation factor 2 [Schistosoma japonicum]
MMGRTLRWKNSPALPGKAYCPTKVEQLANCISHVPCVPLGVVGMIRLYSKADTYSELVAAIVYGLAIVSLFFASSVFHLFSLFCINGRLCYTLQICDRIVICLFIAASYTPWLLLRDFHASWGLTTLWSVWIAALFGCAFQYIYLDRFKSIELMIYLAISICPAYSFLYMHEQSGLPMLLSGAFVYLSGVIFFKLDGHLPLAHAIWHCFVFIATLLQFNAVETFLLTN